MLRSAALRAAGPAPGSAFRRRAVATLAAGAVMGAGLAVPASAAPPAGEEPGVTLRTFAFGQAPSEICTLKEGTTPNVDKLMPTISWTEADEFGMEDNFLTHVLATLEVPADGEYTFRLTSDDGSKLHIDDELVIDHDGLHGAEPKDGSVTLTAGYHSLFIEHIEAGGGQELHLEWQVPGASDFELVPSSALSTEADVVRVTAPGTKYCEGATDTAGDGLRLDSVNPNYVLTNLRPEGFEPKVSGLALTPDGQLAVSTTGEVSAGGWEPDPTSGEVFFLDGVLEADGPEDVTVTKVADGLLNPMGIEVIDDSIFVSERHQLTQLTDPDGDGFYDARTTIADWPDGGNFHEFAFGLVHDEDYFYVNLSVAINNGGATTDPQPGENRGTSIKIDRETGEVTYVAGGLRTPNGIAFGPNGDLFATDNQGAWLPSNKLVHIEQGKFFNHYTNPDGPFDDQPVSPPAVWIPQNEIGNSPSQPALLQEGPFAGQMLIGDVTYGGLQRAFLEEVDGEYQGAVFRHSAGFESGINRTIVGPDGSIYVGGTGEGGNWGESGKLRYGLQKLTPVNEDTFDMKEVRVVEGGFEIEYTHPVSEETAATIAEAYQVEQWRYQPTQQYGGPKIDEHALSVSNAELSEDRTTVTLAIDGLTPGYVVHLRSPRPFTDEDGQELWNTEAWYTLNSLPGYVPPPDDGYYEAEEALTLGGSTVAADHSNYSGIGFAANIQAAGSGRQFEVTVDEAGTYPVNLRYANGIHPYPELRSKNVSLYVNGEDLGQWTLPTTGDWKTWEWATKDLELEAGANTITLQYDEGDEGNVNFDVLSIGENPDICTPAEPEDGYTALFDGTLASLNDGWRMAGPGGFGRQDDCSLRGEGGMGLLWYTEQQFEEYSLTLDWKLVKDDNGGVFVGFPDPGNDPWVAVDQGYEIQIDATDEVDRTTGAVYTFQGADLEARDEALNPVGSWNSYDIRVQGDNIKIYLNDVLVNDFTSTDPARDLSSGFIGFQNHGGGETVYYRDVQVKDLSAVEVTPEAVTFADEDGTENDTFTVPEVEGVEYVVDDEVVAAGPNPGTGTVTVTARAQDGYVLAEGATAEWTFTFSTDAAPVLVPADQVSIGLYSLIPWVGEEGLPSVLARLAEIGLENIEPYGSNFDGYTAEQFREMVDSIGLNVLSSHYNVGEANFDQTLEYVETLGQQYVGSGGFPAPGIGSYENTLATAEAMDRLGQRSVEAGVGKLFGHNHA
ncbi:Glucose/arabinose dehydrogenase, beta-propeller fold, partial [Georgenia satyanarayanai]